MLRKDFLVREAQLDVVEADLVLLIARFVGRLEGTAGRRARTRFSGARRSPRRARNSKQALDAGADLIGVNNRDLARLEVDLGTFESVAPVVPEDMTLVAESGIATRQTSNECATPGRTPC